MFDLIVQEKEEVMVFTCEWCQQEHEGRPVLLVTPVRRLAGGPVNEEVCATCADLAAAEELARLVVVVAPFPPRVCRSLLVAVA